MTTTSKMIAFCNANQTDPRVVRIVKAMGRPLSIHGNLGKLIGELMREMEAA